MAKDAFYRIVFSVSLIILGAGSFAMHASNTSWGGFGDLLGMFLLSAFIFCYALSRLPRISKTVFCIIFLMLVGFNSWLYWQPFRFGNFILTPVEITFIGQLFFAFLIELYRKYVLNADIQFRFHIYASLLLGLAFLIWNLSRTRDSWWCDPESLLQGHAFWHLINGLAVLVLYKYFLSENDLKINEV